MNQPEERIPPGTDGEWSIQSWRRPVVVGAAVTIVVAIGIVLAVMWSSAQPRTHSFTIPDGTQTRIDRGEYMDLFPETLRARVGDTLVIENQDVVAHQFGPYVVRSGERLNAKLSQAGTFPGPCSVNDSKSTEVVGEE